MAIEVFLQIADGVSAVMKNRGGERGIGLAFGEDFDEMVGRARAARGDHRDVGGAGDGAVPGRSRIRLFEDRYAAQHRGVDPRATP